MTRGTIRGGRVLVVEDAAVNRMILERLLRQQGHSPTGVADGLAALDLLADGEAFDVVLLDLVMPGLDGYAILERIKADPRSAHVPVIIITAIDEVDSVVRCIELGALDHLTKPVHPAILAARLDAALGAKRLRDLELEYLEQVDRVSGAAVALEADRFDPQQLDPVAVRDDALGQLARTFQRMAIEVQARQARLRQQIAELRIEIDEGRQAQRVAEITETDYFRSLRGRAADLRRIVADAPDADRDGG